MLLDISALTEAKAPFRESSERARWRPRPDSRGSGPKQAMLDGGKPETQGRTRSPLRPPTWQTRRCGRRSRAGSRRQLQLSAPLSCPASPQFTNTFLYHACHIPIHNQFLPYMYIPTQETQYRYLNNAKYKFEREETCPPHVEAPKARPHCCFHRPICSPASSTITTTTATDTTRVPTPSAISTATTLFHHPRLAFP